MRVQQGLELLEFGSFTKAGFPKEFFDLFDSLHRVGTYQQNRDTEFLSLFDHKWTWTQVPSEDKAGCGRCQSSQLDIRSVTTRNHSLVGGPAEAAEGSLCSHGSNSQIFNQSFCTL